MRKVDIIFEELSMIKISNIRIESGADVSRLTADIDVDGKSAPLWFEVEPKYGKYLTPERCDAYVLAVLHYALRYGHDIVCDTPMTDRLWDGLCGQFIPAFQKANSGRCHLVDVKCPLDGEVERIAEKQVVATGVSCGVDSMHVFAGHADITHGCIWNGHGRNWDETEEKREKTWNALVRRAREFTSHLGIELVVGNSNFDHGCIPEIMWDGMTTNGNLFCIFALQKLWSKYYVASDCAADIFRFSIPLDEDPAHYEFFLFPLVSLPHMQILMDGADKKRIEKIGELVDYKPAQRFLNTCWRLSDNHNNCSHECPKCMRTMLGLWCYGALDRFSGVYDVGYFKTHLHEYLAEVYRGCIHKDFFAVELLPYLKKMDLPMVVKIKAWGIVAKKIVKKALRLGAVSQEFKSR